MIPDDESVRRAMQSIEPAGADVPGLFDRVAAGARRRRRQRSIGAVVAAAVVVTAVALVPALGRRHSSTNAQPAGPGAVRHFVHRRVPGRTAISIRRRL